MTRSVQCGRCGRFVATKKVWVGFGRFIRTNRCKPCTLMTAMVRRLKLELGEAN